MVYESLTSCGEIERKRIEDCLESLDDRMLSRRHEWDPQLDWLTNAEGEHERKPFHAIVARANPNHRDFVLEGDGLDETHPLWRVSKLPIPPIIPKGMKVRLVRWCQRDGGEKLHNRFILTDMGGVRFGVGLDDGADGETDEIELLGDETYKLRLAQYTSTSAFDLVDEVVVEGKRILSSLQKVL